MPINQTAQSICEEISSEREQELKLRCIDLAIRAYEFERVKESVDELAKQFYEWVKNNDIDP